jgi:hypothetical protein
MQVVLRRVGDHHVACYRARHNTSTSTDEMAVRVVNTLGCPLLGGFFDCRAMLTTLGCQRGGL